MASRITPYLMTSAMPSKRPPAQGVEQAHSTGPDSAARCAARFIPAERSTAVFRPRSVHRPRSAWDLDEVDAAL